MLLNILVEKNAFSYGSTRFGAADTILNIISVFVVTLCFSVPEIFSDDSF